MNTKYKDLIEQTFDFPQEEFHTENGNLLFHDIDLIKLVKTIFMKDSVGEHLSFFVKDPNNYMLEFKCFKNDKEVFLF